MKPDNEDIDAIIDQARWLFQFHTDRADGVSNRAVAILGFNGVMLALLLNNYPTSHLNLAAQCTLGVTVVLLLGSCMMTIRVIGPREVHSPSVLQARDQWSEYVRGSNRDDVKAQIANRLLNASEPNGISPVTDAMTDADERVLAYKWSAGLTAVGAAVLGILVFLTG